MRFRFLVLSSLVLLVAGFVGAIVVLGDRVHERDARAALQADLERSAVVTGELAGFRSATLASALHVTAEEPRLKAVVATDEVEHATVLDVAQELRHAMKADVFLMVDGEGRLMADTAAPAEQGARLDGLPLVARALGEGASEAVWIADERAVQVAARRMAFGDEVVGAVVAGRALDDSVADSIARQSGSVVVMMLDGRRIAAAGVDAAALDGLVPALADVPSDGSTTELVAAGTRWMAQRRSVPGYAGDRELSIAVVRSLDAALAPSIELSRRFQQIAGIAMLVAIALALVLSRVLSRPLDRLVGFTHAIAAGQLDARAPIRGPQEIRVLGRAMNAMAGELAGSRAQLEAINQSLERTVDERTSHLRAVNAEIGEMLDHLDDAVMIVNRSLHVEPRCSPACAKLLGVDQVAGADIRDVLFAAGRLATDAEALAMHAFVFENSFGEPEWQWAMNEHLLLREVVFRHPVAPHERTFSLRYAPLFDEAGDIARIMLVVTDLTEVLALRKSVEAEQRRSTARVDALLALSRCSRRDALQFVDESLTRMPRVLEGIERWVETRERALLVAVMRELHTLKGNARALRLKEISTRAHALEGAVQCMLAPGAESSPTAADDLTELLAELRPALASLEEQIAIHAAVADEILRRESERPRVDNERMRTWLSALASDRDGSRIASMRALLAAEANEEVGGVARLLEQQRPMIDEVGQQLGKQVRLDLEPGCELFVAPTVAGRLRDAFVHAIRNAVDHGIESPDERVRLGKPPTGVITLRWQLGAEGWCVELSDDGRGVDLGAIENIARRRGMLGETSRPSDAEILELSFVPSLSSKQVVDDISGRGVGLDAIRTGLAACGIRAELRSTIGRGTTVALYVPTAAVCFEERDGVPVGEAVVHHGVAA
ncbi:MAG TPA: HAMP domain-containing protein [Nannocystaceae bacterium]|nr:HAMP domain-containing protein [Nannocystaceae bacterium]